MLPLRDLHTNGSYSLIRSGALQYGQEGWPYCREICLVHVS